MFLPDYHTFYKHIVVRPHLLIFTLLYRVNTLEEGSGEATLAGLMVMNMKEALAFSQMEEAHVITTEKINGATTGMSVISPQNAEVVLHQEG